MRERERECTANIPHDVGPVRGAGEWGVALGKGRASLSHLTEGKPCQVSQLKIFPSFWSGARLIFVYFIFCMVGFAKCLQCLQVWVLRNVCRVGVLRNIYRVLGI